MWKTFESSADLLSTSDVDAGVRHARISLMSQLQTFNLSKHIMSCGNPFRKMNRPGNVEMMPANAFAFPVPISYESCTFSQFSLTDGRRGRESRDSLEALLDPSHALPGCSSLTLDFSPVSFAFSTTSSITKDAIASK